MHLKTKLVKIRKLQVCWGCGTKFPTGCILEYNVSICEGEFSCSYWCPICLRILSDRKYKEYIMDDGDGIAEYSIIEELNSQWLEMCSNHSLFIMEKESWPKFC